MEIDIYNSFDDLSQKASDLIVREIEKKKNLLLCVATGGSPTETYQYLAKKYEKSPDLFDQLRVIKLDEWGGIPLEHSATCESYLKELVIDTLHLSADRYIGFNSNPRHPQEECLRIQKELKEKGPIDLCILGLGTNGHLALNEPADYLEAHCHRAELAPSSLQHQMIANLEEKPSYGLTLGMADILQSKMILLIVKGKEKKNMVSQLLTQEISTRLPASLLWLHPNVICMIEKEATL